MALPDDPADDIFLPGGRLRRTCRRPAAALRESLAYARATNWDSVRSPHLFMGLLAVPGPRRANWGDRLGADLPGLLDQFRELFHQDDGDAIPPLLAQPRVPVRQRDPPAPRGVPRAGDHRRRQHHADGPAHHACSPTPNSIVAECFERIGVTAAKLTELAVMAEQFADLPR